MTKEQINKQFTAKVRAGIFNPVRRYLTNSYTAEDRWQEAVALTWLMYARYATRGKVLDDGILVQKCRWTATDLSRRFVPAGDTQPYKDALDPRAYRDGRVTVHRLDGIVDDEREGDRALEIGLAEALAASPERKLNSAHDLRQWVGDLSFRDQAILELKMAGYTLEQIAHELDLGISTVCQRAKALGLELARRAGVRIDLGKNARGRPRKRRDVDAAVQVVNGV